MCSKNGERSKTIGYSEYSVHFLFARLVDTPVDEELVADLVADPVVEGMD